MKKSAIQIHRKLISKLISTFIFHCIGSRISLVSISAILSIKLAIASVAAQAGLCLT